MPGTLKCTLLASWEGRLSGAVPDYIQMVALLLLLHMLVKAGHHSIR